VVDSTAGAERPATLLSMSLLALLSIPAAMKNRTVRVYSSRNGSSEPLMSFSDLVDLVSSDRTFSVPADSFSEATATEFVKLASLSYCPAAKITAWTCSWCSAMPSNEVSVIYESSTDTLVYTAYLPKQDRVLVSFRGSQSLTNWIYNLKFSKTSAYPLCDGCKVHHGFYRSWLAVADEVTNSTKALLAKHPSAQLYITGHSLGGSLAALAAAHFAYSQKMAVHGVYTYGESRVGNPAFRQFYNQGARLSWRLTHYKDPVPHLPMKSLGFAHISTEVFYDEKFSSYKLCDDSGEDPTCSDGVAWDSLLYISDHCTYLNQSVCDPSCG